MQRFLVFPLYLFLAGHLAAQPALLEKKGTLHLEGEPLKVALRKVEAAWPVSFSWFGQLDERKKVSLQVQDQPLRESLEQLLSGTGLTWELAGNQVILKKASLQQPAYLTLRGSVLDRETKEPLAYAAVAVQGKPTGTVANAAGDFELHLPMTMEGDSVRVSLIGYTAFSASVKELQQHDFWPVFLQKQTYQLSEVVVSDSLPDLGIIMQRVEKNIPRNYLTMPYRAKGFYREIRQKDYVGQSLVEAAVSIYDKGYDQFRLKEKVVIDQIRTSYQHQRPYGDGWDEINLLRTFLYLNEMRHRNDLFGKKVRYSLAGTTIIDGKPVYIITADDPVWPVTAYVNAETYAVLRLEKRPQPDDSSRTYQVPESDSVSARILHRSFVAEFREHEGKYYLSHQRIEDNLQYYNRYTGQAREVYTIQLELIITAVSTEPAPEPAGQSMKDYSMGQQAKTYDPAFWQHYNVLRETPLEEKIRRDLEHQKPLEKQFSESGASSPRPTRKSKRP